MPYDGHVMREPSGSRIPIAPILKHYGAEDVPDVGTWWKMLCPFHGDQTPSASVNTNPEVQLFVCHSCDMRGQAAHLIMKREGLDFHSAQQRAAEIAGVGDGEVHASRRPRNSVPRSSRDKQGRRRYRRARRGDRRD